MNQPTINDSVKDIAIIEADVEQQLATLQQQYPDIFKQIEYIEEQKRKVNEFKESIKQRLIDTQDFDLHEVDGVKISVSKIAKLDVDNINDVPDEFKEVATTANVKKATDYMKVMGEMPKGFKDKSYYRLNWKVEKSNDN